jgi:uroporphyrinogen decarboxylase
MRAFPPPPLLSYAAQLNFNNTSTRKRHQGIIEMHKRDMIRRLISGEAVERCGFWMGNPHADMWPIMHEHFGTASELELQKKVGDDLVWIRPGKFENAYQHPDGLPMFSTAGTCEAHASRGPLADAETVSDVERYPWPNPDYLNIEPCLEALRNTGDVYRMSGYWTDFYHKIMDIVGMEEYLVKMYTHPEVIHAITNRACEFFLEANERFFQAAGNLIDAFFFGNDFGTQQGLICGPVQFDEFILPWFEKFTEQGHRHGHQVVLHSCGSVHEVIDRLIDAGVDCLHPLQAKAANMDAETLARDFKGRIAFMGGIDTQDLLVNGTPDQVREEVSRVQELLGPSLIISPSHEALLPDIPPENVAAMAEAAQVDVSTSKADGRA